MVTWPSHAPRRRRAIVAVALAMLMVVIPGATGTTVAPGGALSTSHSTQSKAADVFAAPFSARAGYSAENSAVATDVVPAHGSQLVVVTFQPRDPSFFIPPAPGAAAQSNTQIAMKFGLSSAEYSGVESYFRSEGLSVVHTWPDRLSLTLDGPVASIGRAFGTSIWAGWHDGVPVTYPASAPSLPSGIEPLVGSVLGLTTGFDSFLLPSLAPVSIPAANPAQGSADLVTPAIARSIYDLSSLYNVSGTAQYATSESIALLLWGWGYAPGDVQSFFQQDYPSSFPSPTIAPYAIDGAPAPSPNAVNDPCKSSQELTLDLEWAGSMAPGATLDAVYAPESAAPMCSPTTASMADAFHQAVSLPVSAVSMSFGTPESSDQSLAAAWQTDIGEADQKGITLLAATGDLGGDAQPNCQGGPMPQYPSTSADVLAVGGTAVTLQRNLLGQLTGFSESAWSESGGGYSTQNGAPTWQSNGSGGRGVPDVSATAADNFVYFAGSDEVAGGTSFATPLWAGLMTEMDAIHGRAFGLVSPRLYSIGEAESSPGSRIAPGLADITSGNTCVASAGPGWDAATGWGSPRALLLYEDLTATFVNLSIQVAPSSVAQGGTVTITGHLSNITTGAAITNVPVAVSLVSSTDIGPCTGVFGSSTPATDGGGNLSVSVRVPVCYLGSHATAQVAVTADGYYGTNSTTVAVNLLGLVPGLGGLADYPYNLVTFVVIIVASVSVGYVLGRGRHPAPSVAPSAPVPPTVGGTTVPEPEAPAPSVPGNVPPNAEGTQKT